MKSKLKSRLFKLVCALAIASVAVAASVALADILRVNSLETGGNASLPPGGSSLAQVYLQATDEDAEGCNASVSTPVSAFVESSRPDILTFYAYPEQGGTGAAGGALIGCGPEHGMVHPYYVSNNAQPGDTVLIWGGAFGGQFGSNYIIHPFTVTVGDGGGDVTAPEAPIITGPANGTATNDGTPTFSGTAELGSMVTIYDGGTPLGTTTAGGSGNWEFTPGSPLSEGEHQITARATDAAGNVSSPSAVVSITIEPNTPPPPPPPNDNFADAQTISGTSVSVEGTTARATRETGEPDHYTSNPADADWWVGDHSVWYRWTAPETGEVTFDTCDSGHRLDSVLAVYTGSSLSNLSRVTDNNNDYCGNVHEVGWGAKVSFEAVAGAPYYIAVSDVGGLRENTFNLRLELTNDTTPPAAPSFPDLDPASDTGISSRDNVTSDATPTIKSTAEAGSTVELFDVRFLLPDTSLGTVTADNAGTWSVTTDTLADGVHELKAVATDKAGNRSPDSGRLSVTIDTRPPATPQNLELAPESDTGSPNDNITSDTTPTITGTAEAGSIIKIFTGTSSPGSTTADGSGNWSFTLGTALGTPLENGTYSITAKAMDKAGNTSEESTPALSVTIAADEPSGTQGPGKIVFVSDRDGNLYDIYTMDPDGGGVKQLSRLGLFPTISPDGKKFAYAHASAIYVMNSDGSGQDVKVIDRAGDFLIDEYLAWSPDGTKLAVHGHSNDPNSTSDIFTINADGTGQPTNVTNTNDANEYYPSWSSDGKIAFTSQNPYGSIEYENNPTTEIFTINADGSGGRKNLTNTSQRWEDFPSWSPDASKIAYMAFGGPETYGTYNVFTMKADGTEQDKLTNTPGYEEIPSWSPDGTKVVFTAVRSAQTNHTYDIFTINADGTGESNLTLDSKSYLPVGNEYSLDRYARWGPSLDVDETAPATPEKADLDASSDTGSSSTDNVTSDNTPAFTGTTEPGATVEVFAGAASLGTTTADSSGIWSFTAPTLPDGIHLITVKATDAAGNTSVASTELSIVIDTEAHPPQELALAARSDTGVSSTDGVTNDATPEITGTAEPGSRISVYADDSLLGTVTADGEGNWSFEVPEDKTLGDGAYSITAKATDRAGNTSSYSGVLSVTVDTVEPNVATADLNASSDTGNSEDDNVTSDNTPAFSGTAEANSEVSVYTGDTLLGTAATDDEGNWSFTVPDDKALGDGVHQIKVTATDAAGNTSNASDALSLTIDRKAPTTPEKADLDASSDTGNSSTDNVTNDNTPAFTGTTEPGATVEVFAGATSLGTATADSSGIWSFTAPTLADGTYSITTRAMDKAGNTSEESTPALSVTIDTQAAEPQGLKLDASSDTGSSSTDNVTNDATPTLTGAGEPGSRVSVYAGDSLLGATAADDSGNWSFTVPDDKALSDGEHSITAKATDVAGNTSVASGVLKVLIDRTRSDIEDKGPTTQPNSNSWYNSPVTNKFSASDAGGSGLANPSQADFERRSRDAEEGSAVRINSGAVLDVAGNEHLGIDSAALRIDLTKPLLGITDNNAASYDVCSSDRPSKPGFNPRDALSGLDSAKTGEKWEPSNTAAQVGSYTYEAFAADNAGNSESYGPKTYKVTYGDSRNGGAYGGVLQPINSDGTSRFKLGSTVPVKFKLLCGTTPITNAVAKLNVKQADGNPDPGQNEATSTAASTTGNLFRYDSTNQQYIFNLSTKSGYTNPSGDTVSFKPGTWTLSILLDDGTHRAVDIQIRQ